MALFVKQDLFVKSGINSGGGGGGNITSLNVTPSTSAQTITAGGGVDGYSPVNVSAVDSSIDPNILSSNIVQGATILGVSGSAVELNGETKTVTPQVYGQTLYPTSPKNGITEITVNAVTSSIDANITAGNIKKDVTILGVTGTLEGTTPTGTMYIISNGTYNVADKAIANVQVPTTAPQRYLEYETYEVETGKYGLRHSTTTSSFIDLSGVDSLTAMYIFRHAYYQNSGLTGTIDMSSIKNMTSSTCANMFSETKNITKIDLSGLLKTTGTGSSSPLYNFASNSEKLQSVDLSSLVLTQSIQSAFYGCPLLTTVDLSSLKSVGSSAFQYTFGNTAITDLKMPAITNSSFGTQTNCFNNMLTSLTNVTVHFPSNVQAKIETLTGYSTTAPFGATSGTVLFDLPSTAHLIGANTTEYERNPKYDTATALAWRVLDDPDLSTLQLSLTPAYYTSGLTDPAVNDTIYSDAACTTTVTTVSSIA